MSAELEPPPSLGRAFEDAIVVADKLVVQIPAFPDALAAIDALGFRTAAELASLKAAAEGAWMVLGRGGANERLLRVEWAGAALDAAEVMDWVTLVRRHLQMAA